MSDSFQPPSCATAGTLIEAVELWKSFDDGRIPVLRGASLTVSRGELVALWGASGSGKSTLLHLLGGLDKPDRGRVSVCGLDPTCGRQAQELRRHKVGFVFQLHNLIPDLTVEENIRVPALAVGTAPSVAVARVRELLAKVGMEHRQRHRVQDLSGGERQRTALCRALFNRPAVLLADEPTGSLDERTAEAVFSVLRQLASDEGVAVVLCTHERRFAQQCDRWLHMREGRVGDL